MGTFEDRPAQWDRPDSQVGKGVWGRLRRAGIAAALSLSLASGVIGGAAVATQWLPAGPPPATVIMAQPASMQEQPSESVASAVYDEVGPSVVQIVVARQTRGRGLTPGGSGSGVVVDEGGYVLTSYHVVAGARSVLVTFGSGDQREAGVVAVDSANDLALLRVDLPPQVPAARLGDSDQVQVGEVAIAIGSPFGLAQTVTQGIISAVGRDWLTGSRGAYRGLIQTDAPINPGNSGGPLVNASGEVIGIASMIESPVAGSVGVGFAVPINAAKPLLAQVESDARL